MVESVETESEIFDSQAALGFTAIMNSDFPLPTVIKKKNLWSKSIYLCICSPSRDGFSNFDPCWLYLWNLVVFSKYSLLSGII